MKHIDGKTLLKAVEMIRRGEQPSLILERTGMSKAQLSELYRRVGSK